MFMMPRQSDKIKFALHKHRSTQRGQGNVNTGVGIDMEHVNVEAIACYFFNIDSKGVATSYLKS